MKASINCTFTSKRKKMRLTFAVFLYMFAIACPLISKGQQFKVTASDSAMELAQRIVGKGITIINPQLTGARGSAGYFVDRTGVLGLDSGIVLTSGRVKTSGNDKGVDAEAILPKANYAFDSSAAGFNGDADLTAAMGRNTFDATVLEFDFIPQGDSINVSFVFGSEEYQGVGTNDAGFICTHYNDVFAFLIDGPGFTGKQNIALVPATNIPVAINSINNGQPGSVSLALCTAMGPGSPFTQYYVDNRNSKIVSYNGLTKILTARAKVIPCSTYHIRLAIADGGDHSYDSGVFIEATSFSSSVMSLAQEGAFVIGDKPVIVEGCKSTSIKIKRPRSSGIHPAIAAIVYSGTAVNGVDYTAPASVAFAANELEKTIDIVPLQDNVIEGDETIKMHLYTGNCVSMPIDSLTFVVKDTITFRTKVDTFVCSNRSTQLVAGKVAGVSNSYVWSTGSTAQSIVVTNPGIYSVLHEFNSTCFNSVEYDVVSGDPVFGFGSNEIICGNNGLVLSAANPGATYLWSTGATTPQIKVMNSGTYSVTVTNASGCIKTATVNATVKNQAEVELGPNQGICAYDSVTLNATYPGATYQWSTGSTVGNIVVKQAGLYWVKAMMNGCTVTDSINIISKRMPLVNAGTDKTILPGGAAHLGSGASAVNREYLWLPNVALTDNTRPNPISYALNDQTYFLKVTSVDGCIGRDTVVVFVKDTLDIPNAFSPNGDGINDTWEIPLLNTLLKVRVEIYNRYGNMIYNSVGYKTPFNGKVNGKLLPPGTYYYVIQPNDGIHSNKAGALTILR